MCFAYCFYLSNKLGIKTPPTFFSSTLNNAVDSLLKKEFDKCRNEGSKHYLFDKFEIDVIPFQHPDIDSWRNVRKGITYHFQPLNFVITGAVDDIWITSARELVIVDYKTTNMTNLENKESYRCQMEIYQWLFRKNGFRVLEIGYFLVCRVNTYTDLFRGNLSFDYLLLPHRGDDSWIEPTLNQISNCLKNSIVPQSDENCETCKYRQAISKLNYTTESEKNYGPIQRIKQWITS